MKSLLAVPAALLLTIGLASCSMEVTVGQSELEDAVAEQITPNNADDEVTVSCDGDLDGEVGATQDCPTVVGEDDVIARVEVTEVDGSDVDFDITPVLTPEVVGETIKVSIEGQGFEVDTVECDGELIGVEDETLSCTVAPADGDGAIDVVVTSVDGLLVNFDYQVVS